MVWIIKHIIVFMISVQLTEIQALTPPPHTEPCLTLINSKPHDNDKRYSEITRKNRKRSNEISISCLGKNEFIRFSRFP